MNITRSDGKNIPFAADIYDEQGNVIGNVGQGGQAFVRGIEQQEISALNGSNKVNP